MNKIFEDILENHSYFVKMGEDIKRLEEDVAGVKKDQEIIREGLKRIEKGVERIENRSRIKSNHRLKK
jgi:archaellum component FlaC